MTKMIISATARRSSRSVDVVEAKTRVGAARKVPSEPDRPAELLNPSVDFGAAATKLTSV
ncbi:MAG: hypothetical protein ABWY93_15995 [Mycobacterium sp.]